MSALPRSPRAIDDDGLALIRHFEGFSATVYVCPAGYPTIGYGHVVTAGESWPTPLTTEQGEALLRRDMARYERAVCRLIEVPLTDPCYAALVSFTYNLGEGALAASTLRRLVNRGELRAAADQFGRWVQSPAGILPGLVRRRAAEREMWVAGL
ncbi:MAG: lysozyme [Alphaproteobacteria bacterium]|nr:lysozyme [Alphaproteobacteria bacterium]